jgi:hypothetical protein
MYFYCNVIIINLLIFVMTFDKFHVQSRIRILPKVSDPCGSGLGSESTTLISPELSFSLV